MAFKSLDTPMEQIPLKQRGAFGRWKKIHSRPLNERFMEYVSAGDPEACWPFTGERNKRGYGVFTVKSKPERIRYLAHRFSYAMHIGPVPDNLHVCHHCDNPPCCNPKHLFLGDDKANMADCRAKGRSKGNRLRGEHHQCAKLTEEQAKLMRHYYATGRFSHRVLSLMFGISKPEASAICSGSKWTHLGPIDPNFVATIKANLPPVLPHEIKQPVRRDPEKNGSAKLTKAKAREIRAAYQSGQYTHKALAAKYRVAASNICRIISGKAWKEI